MQRAQAQSLAGELRSCMPHNKAKKKKKKSKSAHHVIGIVLSVTCIQLITSSELFHLVNIFILIDKETVDWKKMHNLETELRFI